MLQVRQMNAPTAGRGVALAMSHAIGRNAEANRIWTQSSLALSQGVTLQALRETRSQLSKIYEPIQQDLAKVEDRLRSVSKVDMFSLVKQLAYDLKDSGNVFELLTYSLDVGGKPPP